MATAAAFKELRLPAATGSTAVGELLAEAVQHPSDDYMFTLATGGLRNSEHPDSGPKLQQYLEP